WLRYPYGRILVCHNSIFFTILAHTVLSVVVHEKDVLYLITKHELNDMAYQTASLKKLAQENSGITKLPFSIRILLENVLRNHDNFAVTDEHLDTLINCHTSVNDKEIRFKPARALRQDFTGVPAIVDIASIRAEVIRKGGDGSKINPAIPVDLVIDHSVQVDYFGTTYSYQSNVELE